MRVKGKEHLRGINHAVTISNHCLYLDPAFAAYSVGVRRLFFSGLEQTFVESRKPFELLIRLLGGFPIPRRSPWSILEPIQQLVKQRKRTLIHFFPEGKMTYRNQKLKTFKVGGFLLSDMLHVPVIPMVTIITPRSWWCNRLTIEILPPIYLDIPEGQAEKKAALKAAAESARQQMQQVIDSYHAASSST